MSYDLEQSNIRISYSGEKGTAFILVKDGNTQRTIPLGKIKIGKEEKAIISSYKGGWKICSKNPESKLKKMLTQ